MVGLHFSTGGILTFTATGGASQGGGNPLVGPDGNASGIFSHFGGAANGISDIRAPIAALVGVFLSDAQPDTNIAPSGLDFSTPGLRNFTNLAPELQQVFYIGDGRNDASDVQTFVAPTGANRLFLGIHDVLAGLTMKGPLMS